MSYETILVGVQGGVATVTLNRPQVLHALNAQVFNELEQVFREFAADDAVRVVLVTGAGEKAFAAGADIREIAASDAALGELLAQRGQGVFRQIETCGKPVIALVNGFALGVDANWRWRAPCGLRVRRRRWGCRRSSSV